MSTDNEAFEQLANEFIFSNRGREFNAIINDNRGQISANKLMREVFMHGFGAAITYKEREIVEQSEPVLFAVAGYKEALKIHNGATLCAEEPTELHTIPLFTIPQMAEPSEPVAVVEVGENDYGPFIFEETDYGADTLSDGIHKLYATPQRQQPLKRLSERRTLELWREAAKDKTSQTIPEKFAIAIMDEMERINRE